MKKPFLAACCLLSACGGGGGAPPAQAPNPAGLYSGEFFSSPSAVADLAFAIVDENGDAAMFIADSSPTQYKAVYRFALPKAATFNVAYREFPRPGTAGAAATGGMMSGEVVSRDSITGSLGSGAGSPVFLLEYQPTYEIPASLSKLQGSYQYSLPDAGGDLTVQLTIDALGRIVGTDGPCNYSGVMTIPNPAFNAYNVALDRTCSGAPVSYTGLAVFVAANPPDRPQTLILLEYDDGMDFGLGAVAARQP